MILILIQRFGKRTVIMLQLVVFLSFCLAPYGFADAKTESKKTAKIPEVSSAIESNDQIVFQGKGTIETILPTLSSLAGSDEMLKNMPSVIIDGNHYQCAAEIEFFNHLSEKVTIGDLKQNEYVGFKTNMSGMISGLWFLPPSDKNSQNNQIKKPAKSTSTPCCSEATLKNEGGVWKN